MAAFQRASWHWPTNGAATGEEHIDPQVGDASTQSPQEQGQQPHNADEAGAAPPPQRHYPPRQCRICLEEVLPTFETPAGGLAAVLNPTPNVRYISSDPESGRLIRPCKCRGSQQYVHEGCLQQWRHSDPGMRNRYYWECPTCKFQYRLERMRWARYISSTFTQIIITIAIMLTTVFLFGFIADPIINLYLDPLDTITSLPSGGKAAIQFEDEEGSWLEHFVKGLASLGMLGFVKVFFVLGPWQWFNIRNGLGGRRRGGGGGRDRLEDISWTIVIIGIVTFLAAVWTWVRAWTARTLEKAGERVADVQGNDDDFEDNPDVAAAGQAAADPPAAAGDTSDSAFARAESRKTQ